MGWLEGLSYERIGGSCVLVAEEEGQLGHVITNGKGHVAEL